jgi:hypothetical protein
MSTELTEEQYRILMMDSTNRKIAVFCITPRTSQEIVKKIAGNYEEESFQSVVGQALRMLESNEALTFSQGKWKTSERTVEVLNKYFGTQ